MDTLRILVANEPRAYREVIAAAFQHMRPQHSVVAITPGEDLDAEVVHLDPQLVLCNKVTAAMQTRPIAWVMLYPDGETRAEICVDGNCTTVADLEFSNLLALVDQTEKLARLA